MVVSAYAEPHGRDLRPPPIWRAARAEKPGESRQPAAADDRRRYRQPSARGGVPARLWVLAVLARLLFDSACLPRRGAFRAGDQADDRDRRLRRYPLPGRCALQEAGRYLLAAIGGGRDHVDARPAARATTHLGLSHPVIDRRDR